MPRMSTDDLQEKINAGEAYTLTEDFIYQGRVLIPRDRVLTVRDIERLENQDVFRISVEKTQEIQVNREVRDVILRGILKVFSDHAHYKDIPEEKKDAYKDNISNIMVHTPYVASKLNIMLKKNKVLGFHCIHVAIKALILDTAYQNRYNRGMFDGLEVENVFTGALLHDFGYLVSGMELLKMKRLDIPENNKDYLQHPINGAKIFEKDKEAAKLHPNMLRIIAEHEERIDGSGFPNQLKGDDILVGSQIVGLANEIELYLTGHLTVEKKPINQILSRLSRSKAFDNRLTTIMLDEFHFLIHL